MKRIYALLVAIAMIISLTACGGQAASNEKDLGTTTQPKVSYDAQDLDSILSAMTTEVETAVQALTDDSASVLDKLGESYDSYDENKTAVTDFYSSTLKNAEALYSTIETIGIDYFKCVAAQGLDDYDTWDDAMEDFYDAWDDSMEDYYDAWDGIYEDIYDQCDGLIEAASDDLEYDEYSDVWSEMYESYSDAWSAMFEAYSDAWSKTYGNYSAVWSGFYSDETDVDAILKAAAESNNQTDDTENDDVQDTETNSEGQASADAKPVDGEEHEADDFLYVIYDDGTIEITGYTGNDSDVTISSEIDGYPVGRIGESAFEGCTNIESITMWPDPICIGASAFKGCTGLTDFSIPGSVTVINDSVFENCISLESITIWGDVTSIGKAAFKNCCSLKDVSIPSSCLMIGESAFEGCSEMESVTFWGGEVIGDSSFKDCTSLTDISIPSDVTTIGECAFMGCTNLESVIIWGDDVEIGVNAFANCTSLDELPDGAVNTDDVDNNSNEEAPNENADTSADGIRPEFKEAMDAYETFYEEYCDFMKRYSENPSDLELLAEYADMISKVEDMNEAFESWNEDELSDEELKYYLDVNNRVMKMLVDVAG